MYVFVGVAVVSVYVLLCVLWCGVHVSFLYFIICYSYSLCALCFFLTCCHSVQQCPFVLARTVSYLSAAVQEGAGACSHYDVQPGHHHIAQCPEISGGH